MSCFSDRHVGVIVDCQVLITDMWGDRRLSGFSYRHVG